jgi:indole-3-glycerol phosphate synthase
MAERPSILAKILATKAAEVSDRSRRRDLATIAAQAADQPPTRGFIRHLRAQAVSGPAVIAEIKKASPSAGLIREPFEPAAIAARYAWAGATCLSVLTDEVYFQGSDRYLVEARNACTLPVLRKDFTVDPWQVYESRALGADCILLIVAALEPGQLQELYALAREIGLDVLVEAHDEVELEQALACGADLVGVNNRDLHHFITDLATSERLRPLIPKEKIMVTESGVHCPADVERLRRAGVDAFLVGEALMRADDPGAALRELFFEGSSP